jgi:hypothetical protein
VPPDTQALFVGGANASDSNPGTASAPFATIQAAASVATPGTEVRIRDGVYRETVTPAQGGTEAAPIVFTADTRPNGTLAEPIISGAELIPDSAWALTTPAIDTVLGPQGNVYYANITLPVARPTATRTNHSYVSGNTTLADNQIFVRGRQAYITSWPKKANQESLLDNANWFDASRRVQEGSTTTNVATEAQWALRYNLTSNVMRLQNAGLPNIDWSGAFVWDAFTYLPMIYPVSGSGTFASGYNAGTHWLEWALPSNADGRRFIRGEVGPANSRAHFIQIYGARALMTVGDSRNEWYYNAGRLFLRAPDDQPPTGVEYKVRNLGFDITGRSHVHIKNLNFFACEITESGLTAWQESAPGVPVGIPTAGNLIDRCRFRYMHHWDFTPVQRRDDMPENFWPLFVLRPDHHAFIKQHGLRLSGTGTTLRNSVISQCAGQAVVLSGQDARVENNYIEETGYRSGWGSSVFMSVPNRATVTRNTMRRTYRSHINHIGKNKDISFNDMSEFMMLSNDGGCIYGGGRYEGFTPFAGPNTSLYNWYFGNQIGNLSDSFINTRLHHNWIHTSGCRPRARQLDGTRPYLQTVGSGLYFDGDTDGIIVDHNVFWDNVWNDANGNPENKAAFGPYAVTYAAISEFALDPRARGGVFSRYYNNTFASEALIDSGTTYSWAPGVVYNIGTDGEQAAHPDTYDNNIYVRQYRSNSTGPKPITMKATEVGQLGGTSGNGLNPAFTSPGSLYNRPLGGLGFQLTAGSPARGRGVVINGTLDNNGDPIDFVDDATLAPAGRMDCGAYQFGLPPWVPGCDLPQEFINGRPWEAQWS